MVAKISNCTFLAVFVAVLLDIPLASVELLSHANAGEHGQPVLAPLPRKVPAPDDNLTTPVKVALGKQLFFDPRLSGDNSLSCANCHIPEKAFGDGLPRAKGNGGKALTRNTPSLLNVAFQRSYFWDGRSESLEAQALQPIQSPEEMDQDLDNLEREMSAVPGYVEQFKNIFGTNVTREAIADALAAFQRILVTEQSPLDRYLLGDRDALSSEAKQGLELFTGAAGCARCHHGPLLSDGEFYRVLPSSDDTGRATFTGHSEDIGRFRTPSLRNVAQTGPYMHDGSMETLYEVVEYYFRGVPTRNAGGDMLDVEPLLGQSFSDISPLVAFLESLSGCVPEVVPPELP